MPGKNARRSLTISGPGRPYVRSARPLVIGNMLSMPDMAYCVFMMHGLSVGRVGRYRVALRGKTARDGKSAEKLTEANMTPAINFKKSDENFDDLEQRRYEDAILREYPPVLRKAARDEWRYMAILENGVTIDFEKVLLIDEIWVGLRGTVEYTLPDSPGKKRSAGYGLDVRLSAIACLLDVAG